MSGKIIITAGGTAGHIYPAQAIIEHMKEYMPDIKILYIGTRSGMENRLVPPLGTGFKKIRASGFSASRNPLKKVLIYLRFFFNLAAGLLQSLAILNKYKPDYVLGMGGYVCAPVFIAAILLRKKIAIHEQNVIPGRLNRIFAKYAKYIFLSFDDSRHYFIKGKKYLSGRMVISGDPVRKQVREFLKLEPDYTKWGLKSGRFTVTVFGGSLGAEKINESAIELYKIFRQESGLQFLLICGNRFFESYCKKLDGLQTVKDSIIFRIYPYIEEMASIYRISDLIISRAGATTIAELAATGIPAILVPYPQAIENHQYFNAEQLVKNKKAVLISDDKLSGEALSGIITGLLEKTGSKYRLMKDAATGINKLDSAEIIVNTLFSER
jgi:UDP-N-acetylglucosamine--N-acetylmuramyl-(pentapeptide) pyrophosphoryl-undecaprenol N-acetylglucosamine transferase